MSDPGAAHPPAADRRPDADCAVHQGTRAAGDDGARASLGEPRLLYSAVGTVQRYDGEIFLVTEVGAVGYVVYGPYAVLTPGSYEVEFYAMPQELDSRTCCIVDVLRRGATITAEKDFTATELVHRNGLVAVRFEVVEKDTFEFRLTATGNAALTVRYRRPVRLIPSPSPEPKAPA